MGRRTIHRQQTHDLAQGVGQKLDLHHPPDEGGDHGAYFHLLELLKELGRALDDDQLSAARLRTWEAAVLADLTDEEKDRLISRPDEDEQFDIASLAEHRWQNLRLILLRRKGIRY